MYSKYNTKHISCKCKFKFDETKCNSSQWWNNNRWCECKKIDYVKKNVWNPSTFICDNGKYSASIMDDLAIVCDEVIKSYNEEIKTIPTNFNEKILLLKHKYIIN